MFTGLIEEIGVVENISKGPKSGIMNIACNKVLEGMKIGDSISVNGICLTAISFDSRSFKVDFMPETMKVTNLSLIGSGSKVNLERALMVGDRLGGHIVSGHVDGIGRIRSLKESENATEVNIGADESLLRYIIKKGSIAIDGASLTVAEVYDDGFMVSIIPHTKKETTLLDKLIGDIVNIECDSTAKYIEKMLGYHEKKSDKLSIDFLKENGFY